VSTANSNSPRFQLQAARARTREIRPDLSRTAFGDPRAAEDIEIKFSLYADAYADSGRLWTGHLKQLADYLTAEGRKQIADKRSAPTMTQAVSVDGRRADNACEQITLYFGDADNVGDWSALLTYLDSIGAAYVAHRSSSHGHREETDQEGRKALIVDTENGTNKWHLFIPLTEPLKPQGKEGDYKKWKAEVYEPQYGWICGVLSEFGQLVEQIDGHPRDRKYGLDHSTSDLVQPAFVGRRLNANAPPREVRYSLRGGTLNWNRFLEATGYFEARQAQAAEDVAIERPVQAPAPFQVDGQEYAPGEFAQRLRIALRACGLLGSALDARRTYVLCPWASEHSEGEQKKGKHDSSTVLYTTDTGGLQFVCLHAHCTERDARTVWAWLRSNHPDALPQRVIPPRPAQSDAPAPETPIVPEMQSFLEEIWNTQCTADPTPDATAYLQGAGLLTGAEACAGEVKYLPHNKSAISAQGNARLRALAAKQRADAATLTVEEQIEHARLTIARAQSQHAQLVYSVRRTSAMLCGLILRCMSDEPHANHRNKPVGDCASGLLGNPHCAQTNKAVLFVEEPDTYLLYAAPGIAAGVTVYCIGDADSYSAVQHLDLKDRNIYLTMPERGHAKQIARMLRAMQSAPGDIYHTPPPRDLTLAAYVRRGTSAQALCDGGTRIPPDPGAHAAQGGSEELPQIIISTQIHINVAQAIAAIAVLPEVYQRHGSLCQIVEDNDPGAGVWRARRAPEVKEISKDHLNELCSRAARWYKVRAKKEGVDYEPAVPYAPVVAAMHSRGVLEGVRELKSITTTPTLRPDGTLIDSPGYDQSTGIVYMPGMQFDPVPVQPTEAQVVQAIRDLLEVICDFPFKTDAGRSAWLAAVLTRLGRFTFEGPVPMFIIDGNAPGSGKGLLVDTICLLADGKSVPKLRYAGDSDEDEKRIFSILREGSPVACFDNIDQGRELGHDAIDQLLTSDQYKGRVLGKSETPVYNNYTVWFATGNNVRLSGDTSRRTIRILLRTDEEHPEARSDFRHPEPRTWILQNRTRLVTAALTLFRGWYAAGKPRQPLKALGSFEAWTASIRQVCVWASDVAQRYGINLTDPLASNDEEHAQSDEKVIALPALLKGWAILCADHNVPGLPVSEALEALRRDAESISGAPAPNKYRSLRETITELMPQRRSGDLPSPQNLAHLIRSFKLRVATVHMAEGPVQMRFINGHNGARFWAAERVASKTHTPGVAPVPAQPATQPVHVPEHVLEPVAHHDDEEF
jgi:hypothetical protein